MNNLQKRILMKTVYRAAIIEVVIILVLYLGFTYTNWGFFTFAVWCMWGMNAMNFCDNIEREIHSRTKNKRFKGLAKHCTIIVMSILYILPIICFYLTKGNKNVVFLVMGVWLGIIQPILYKYVIFKISLDKE